jgi:hypothetical protein
MQNTFTESVLVSRWTKNRYGTLEIRWLVARTVRVANDRMPLPDAA